MRDMLDKLKLSSPNLLYASLTSISWLILSPAHRKVVIIPHGGYWLFYDLSSGLKLFATSPRDYTGRFSLSNVYERYFRVKGGTVIDAGAELGGFTLSVANRSDKVISIEPDPLNFHLLRWNVLINRLHNVVLIRTAHWNKKKKIPIYRSDKPGQHSLIYKYNKSHKVEVEADTLDNIISELDLK